MDDITQEDSQAWPLQLRVQQQAPRRQGWPQQREQPPRYEE